MLRSMSTAVRYPDTCDEEELDDGPVVTSRRDHQGKVQLAAEPRRESAGNARLFVRAPASVPAERQAGRRGRRDGEEAPRATDPATRAERGQARHAGAPGPRRRP